MVGGSSMKSSLYCFILFFVMGAACASPIQNKPLRAQVDLQGHRGARGLNPENTLIAFQDCFTFDMTTIELDTTLTKDGALIVHHDTWTNSVICQMKDGTDLPKTRVRSMTVDDLRQLDCGTKLNPRFPEQKAAPGESLVTLPEFFRFVKDFEAKHPGRRPILFNIEIKVDEHFTQEELMMSARAMVEAIQGAEMVERTTVQSFRLEILPMVHSLNKALITSALFEPTYWQGIGLAMGFDANRDEILEKTKALGASVVSPYQMYVSHDFVAKAHALNLQVIPWTVNDVEDMKALLEMGVDGLISDYPDRLQKLMKAKASQTHSKND